MFLLGSSALLLALMLAICNLVMGAVALRQISTGRRGRISPERLADVARRAGIIGFAAVSANLSGAIRPRYPVASCRRATPPASKV